MIVVTNNKEETFSISVPVSAGELLDKISILEIKSERIECPDKLVNIDNELAVLLDTAKRQIPERPNIRDLTSKLKQVNEHLWDIENQIRGHEATGEFNEEFVELARSVYMVNDERSRLKRRVNELLNSDLVEEKSYDN